MFSASCPAFAAANPQRSHPQPWRVLKYTHIPEKLLGNVWGWMQKASQVTLKCSQYGEPLAQILSFGCTLKSLLNNFWLHF